jgi:hypothetical protein
LLLEASPGKILVRPPSQPIAEQQQEAQNRRIAIQAGLNKKKSETLSPK